MAVTKLPGVDTEHCILCRKNPPQNAKGESDQSYNTCVECRTKMRAERDASGLKPKAGT